MSGPFVASLATATCETSPDDSVVQGAAKLPAFTKAVPDETIPINGTPVVEVVGLAPMPLR